MTIGARNDHAGADISCNSLQLHGGVAALLRHLLRCAYAMPREPCSDVTEPRYRRGPTVLVLDNLDIAEGKTKLLHEQLGKLGSGKTTLFIDGEALNVGFARASGNLGHVNLLPAAGANVYDIMRHETLVLTRAAVEKLEARFNG